MLASVEGEMSSYEEILAATVEISNRLPTTIEPFDHIQNELGLDSFRRTVGPHLPVKLGES